jgi:SAM-dependent methyltransferase
MQDKINQKFWENRYNTKDTGWDLGSVSTPLKEYIDQLTNKSIRILIPGCGNGYEAEYLYKNGFVNVFIADYASEPIENFKKRVPEFPENQLLIKDFFEIEDKFDLILEQTFFCALDPILRKKYSEKMFALLNENGKLAGLLFDDPLNTDKPPFGGSKEEYLGYFDPYFIAKTFERCHNSIKPRADRELFMILLRK